MIKRFLPLLLMCGFMVGCNENHEFGVATYPQHIVINQVGHLSPPYLSGDKCVITISPPGEKELSPFIHSKTPVFTHIGESVDACLFSLEPTSTPPPTEHVILDRLMWFSYHGTCSRPEHIACIADGVFVYLTTHLLEQRPFLYHPAIGHEVWHAVIGDFHD